MHSPIMTLSAQHGGSHPSHALSATAPSEGEHREPGGPTLAPACSTVSTTLAPNPDPILIARAMSTPQTYQYKLVLLGESAVGKSSLVMRFVKDQFDDYRESTIGAAFLTQSIRLDPSTVVKFEIWDTAGQERYKSLAPMYYRNANCAVVVYDVTQPVRPILPPLTAVDDSRAYTCADVGVDADADVDYDANADDLCADFPVQGQGVDCRAPSPGRPQHCYCPCG